MANCPNCNEKLHFWNIKAECPHCHANIPNHNWEGQLEIDAQNREAAFYKLYSFLNKLKFAVVGTPLRIVRLICSFLPIIGYVVPLASLSLQSADGATSIDVGAINAIAFFTKDGFKIGDILSLLTDSANKQADNFALISLGLLVLSLLFGILAFFFIPILFAKPKNIVIAIFHFISIALYTASPIMFTRFVEAYNSNGFGTCSGSPSFGIYIGFALFLIALVLDVVVKTRPIGENDGKYIPKDELQREYAISIGAIKPD